MELTPFSILNQYLKERLIHPERYTWKKYSFLKIFQHGLSFAVNRFDNKLIKNYLRFPLFIQLAVYYLKSIRNRQKQIDYSFREFVILDPGRVVKGDDGQWHSIYFDKIISVLGRDRVTWISNKKNPDFDCDYEISAFRKSLPYLDVAEKEVLEEMNFVLKRAESDKQFTSYEMRHLRSSMHIFFEEFRFFYHLFKGQKVKTFLFICHYHSEGMIAAAKSQGIQAIEIQHGLIATNDLYYVYHEQFAGIITKAFFPDKILVYGPYWKRILSMGCEFRSRQVMIAGDYLYRLKNLEDQSVEKENVVLICAQKNLHTDYVNYGKKLSAFVQNHPGWRVILKLHPLEKNKPAYQELREYGIEIVDVETPLDRLLKQCRIQISIYSTTFYDALGYDVVNYSLQDYGSMSDYASDMIAEGVASPLLADEDPIEKFLVQQGQGAILLPREDVYAPFVENIVRAAASES